MSIMQEDYQNKKKHPEISCSLNNNNKQNLRKIFRRIKMNSDEIENSSSPLGELDFKKDRGQSRQRLDNLEKELQEGLWDEEIQEENLVDEIEETRLNIAKMIKEKKPKKAEHLKEYLKKLERLYSLSQLIKKSKKSQSSQAYSSSDERSTLKKQLEEGFQEDDFNNVNDSLNEIIVELKKTVADLEKNNQLKDAEEIRKELKELEHLQDIAKKLGFLERDDTKNQSKDYLKESKQFSHQNYFHKYRRFSNNKRESLVHMYKISSSMPHCFERSLIRLLLYVSTKFDKNLNVLNEDMPNDLGQEMQKELDFLQERSEIEKIDLFIPVDDFLQKCQVYIKNEDWESAIFEFRSILKKIRPLDIQKLFHLVNKAEDAAKLAKDQHVILFLGGTGCGKSTTIHFLAGSKMNEVEFKGLWHIAAIDVKNPYLKNVAISPFPESETQYITSVPVTFQDVGGYTKGRIILCDSPGLEDDKNEPEVSIANGIGIVRALNGCKSVKPVVLISYKALGDRMTGLKDLVYRLVGMISGFDNLMRTFSYAFTKVPEREKDRIFGILQHIRSCTITDEESDEGYLSFFTDMLRKAKRNVLVFDLFKDEAGGILDDLAESATIQFPEEVFRFSITEKSNAVLREQLRKHQLSIDNATKHFDYALIKYKLDELKSLHDLLDMKSIIQIYNECVEDLRKNLMENYNKNISTFNHCLAHGNEFTAEDAQEYLICIQHARYAEELKNAHLGEKVIRFSKLLQNMDFQVNNMLSELKQKDLNDISVETILEKIKLLSKYFENLQPHYKEACKELMQKVNISVELFKKSVDNDDFWRSKDDACFEKPFI